MGVVVPFESKSRLERKSRQTAPAWRREDWTALDRLVERLRPAGAVAWEFDADKARVFVIGAEDETLLIVTRSAHGLSVANGWRHELLWQGASLERFG